MRMRIAVCAGLIATVALAESKPKQSAFSNQSSPMRATMTVLALSSSSRQTFAGNQEVYLADLAVGKKGEHQFVRVFDQYPGFGLPIRESLLKSRTSFNLKVTREPECDVPGSQIYLRSGEAVIFNGAVRDSLAARRNDPVPCYKTLHQTIAIAKR